MAKIIDSVKKVFQGFDPESKNLIKNSSWVTIANTLGTIFAFIKTIAITRILGVELFGTYALAIAFIITTQEFLRLNISMGLIRFGAIFSSEERPDKIVAILKFSLALSIISAFISILVLSIITVFSYSTFIKAPDLTGYIIAFAIANSLNFIDAISKASLKLFYKCKINSIIQMIMDTVETGVVIGTLIIYGANLEAFFTAVITARILNSLTCNFAAYRELSTELKPHLKSKINLIKDQKKDFFTYIFGNSLSSSLKVFMNQGDVLLLGNMSNISSVGIYSSAKKLAYAVLTLTDPLASSIFPQLSHLIASKDHSKIKVMIKKITGIMLIPSLIVLVICFFIKSFLIELLFGTAFLEGANPFIILLICALQGSVFFWALPLIQSMGLIKKRFLVYLSAIIIGGITSILLIPSMHASGAAIGLLVANIFITIRFIQAGFQELNCNPSN
ncbi:MAG: oligosaccharide flippase family protein [Bacteroidetes bacterium]|nr:oligosaccharide flippase family protein [Bacteroidota bacterium]